MGMTDFWCHFQIPCKRKSGHVLFSQKKPEKVPKRTAKLRNWRDEAMLGVIEAAKRGMDVNFGVTSISLRDCWAG